MEHIFLRMASLNSCEHSNVSTAFAYDACGKEILLNPILSQFSSASSPPSKLRSLVNKVNWWQMTR